MKNLKQLKQHRIGLKRIIFIWVNQFFLKNLTSIMFETIKVFSSEFKLNIVSSGRTTMNDKVKPKIAATISKVCINHGRKKKKIG